MEICFHIVISAESQETQETQELECKNLKAPPPSGRGLIVDEKPSSKAY